MPIQINVGFELVESQSVIEQRFMKAALDKLQPKLNKLARTLRKDGKTILRKAIERQQEYYELVSDSGILSGVFGFPDDGYNRLKKIIDIWIDSLDVSIQHIRGLKYSIVLEAIHADFADVIDTEAAIVITEKNTQLRWLEWILMKGTNIIVTGYHVQLGNFPHSRSGDAIMTGGGNWSVPPMFAGTIDDNFVTRAIIEAQPDIEQLFRQSFKGIF